MKIEAKSRLLFMKYALPCAGTLVKRGTVTQDYVNSLFKAVKNNDSIPKNAEKMFRVAFSACSLIALDSRKKIIDENVIREYFLFRHDDAIDRRYEEMGDFNPEACRTRSGIVRSVEKNVAVVENAAGKKKYKTIFTNDIKPDDNVVTHWDFIVEKIDKSIAKKMDEVKATRKIK